MQTSQSFRKGSQILTVLTKTESLYIDQPQQNRYPVCGQQQQHTLWRQVTTTRRQQLKHARDHVTETCNRSRDFNMQQIM